MKFASHIALFTIAALFTTGYASVLRDTDLSTRTEEAPACIAQGRTCVDLGSVCCVGLSCALTARGFVSGLFLFMMSRRRLTRN